MGDHLITISDHLVYTAGGHLSNECPSIGAKGYIFYGAPGATWSKLVDEYDSVGDVWSNLADAPEPSRGRLACFTITSKAYAVSGNANTGLVADNDEFDPSVPVWTARSDIIGTRAFNPGTDINSKGYVFGDQSALVTDEYVVDSWASRTAPPDRKDTAYAATIDSFAYVMCGRNTQNMDRYGVDSWTAMTNFPGTARGYVMATTIDSKIYQVGGNVLFSATYMQDNYEYDPDTWTAKTSAPAPTRSRGRAFTIGSLGFFCGGYNGSQLADCDYYSPIADAWTAIADLLSVRLDMGSAAI